MVARRTSGFFEREETYMRNHFAHRVMVTIAAVGMGTVISASITAAQAQTSAAPSTTPASVPRTPWGEPDLQGIWTVETDAPLQRLAKYENQEFFTEAQRAELDRERAALLARDRGSER